MNWWSKVVWVVLAILVIAVLLYRCFDLAISLDYARQEAQVQKEQVGFLRGLFRQTANNLTRAQVESLVEVYEKDKDHFVKRGSDQVEIDGIVFRFKGDSVVAVTFGEDRPATDR